MLSRLTMLRKLSARLAPAAAAPILSASFSSPAASRRARRLRRSKTSAKAADNSSADPRTPSILADIAELSRNGLARRVEMPTELLERLASVVRSRTHSQLEMLRQKHVGDRRNTRQVPLDMSKTPLGWTMDRSQQIPPFAYGPAETLAFLAYEMEATYACTHAVFTELQKRLPDFKPKSVLDFGSGPGTASWVAKDFYDQSLDKYRVVEPSQSMVDAAEVVLEGFPGLSMRRNITDLSRDIDAGNKYDLVVVSYVFSDITNDFERVATTSALWELLSEDGCLVIVDRGSPWGSHHVRSARQFVLDLVAKDANGKEGVRIVAPCPHHDECPVGGNMWCHFVQRSPVVNRPREVTTKRWHGQKGSKFSYMIMQKTRKGSEEDAAAKKKKPIARLLLDPLLATRHVHLDLCTPEGKHERRSVTRGKAVREVYRASRKAHWGALWPADESSYLKDK
ncbi:Mitochondrial small ribosomal subunit Rsm22 [Phytophthora infestans]|uniref:Mitochondrial small ribosomal subunit Rsm22 n=1 Tax=Phytophthora infestans TaxID=4787 RepID=A0A8S9V8N2_PHYIN|nr:Mitochondrial small ribosomal subunit Rsm22 [Phytophthora infestans]